VTLREDPSLDPPTPDPQNIKSQSPLLDQRWYKARAVLDTLKIHYVKSLSFCNVELKPFAKLTDKNMFLFTIKCLS